MCNKEVRTSRMLEIPDLYMLAYIKPMTMANKENMLFALKNIEKASKNLVVYINENTREIIVAGMGEEHLDNIINELVKEYGIELTIIRKQAFYKETIKTSIKSEGRYIKQNSALEQYGHCWLEIAPKKRDTGSEFINNIKDDEVIPKEYIEPIESGIKRVISGGYIGNFPITDILVTLYDGSYHYSDSKRSSFMIAASMALRKGFAKAGTILLEPLMNLHIRVYEIETEKIIEDIINKRGEILYKDNKNSYDEISVIMPLQEIIDKPQILFKNPKVDVSSVSFSHYGQVQEDMRSSIIEKYNIDDYYYLNLDELINEEGKILKEIKWCENYRDTHPNERTISGKDQILGEGGSCYMKLSQIRNPIENILVALNSFEETLNIYKLRGDTWRSALKLIDMGNAYIKLSKFRDCAENISKAKEIFHEVLAITQGINGCSRQYEEALYYLSYIYIELFKLYNFEDDFKAAISSLDKLIKEETSNSYIDILSYINIARTLGKVYVVAAQVNKKEDYLLKAINIFKEILKSKNLKNPSLDYLDAQLNLGSAYYKLWVIANSEEYILSAIECYKEALKINENPDRYTFKEVKPLEYAKVEYNLGKAYFMLSKVRDNEEILSYAIESFDETLWCYFEALKINSIEKYPLCYAEINANIGKTYMKLSRIHNHEENCLKAINYFEEALKVYGKEKCIWDSNRLNEYINAIRSSDFNESSLRD